MAIKEIKVKRLELIIKLGPIKMSPLCASQVESSTGLAVIHEAFESDSLRGYEEYVEKQMNLCQGG